MSSLMLAEVPIDFEGRKSLHVEWEKHVFGAEQGYRVYFGVLYDTLDDHGKPMTMMRVEDLEVFRKASQAFKAATRRLEKLNL